VPSNGARTGRAVAREPVVLKSGRKSNWYVNWRTVSNDVFLVEHLAEAVVAFIRGLVDSKKIAAPDCIYGVPEGATKIGILSQYFWAKQSARYAIGSHRLAMGRGSVKQHGAPEDRYFVGMPTGKIVLLEDVTTTGGSLLSTFDQLVEAGLEVIAAVGLTNRMELRDDRLSVEEAIATKTSSGVSIPYFSMSNALDLLPEICRIQPPAQSVKDSIIDEFREFGVRAIVLP
jgi:orotate phosphoribosyltransferase